MQKELINQALALFDTPEKWNAFVEIANQKDNMRDHWLQKAKQPLLEYFMAKPTDGWVCEPWGDNKYDLRWYLAAFGRDSLALATGWRFQFTLHVKDLAAYDEKVINNLLRTTHSPLLAAFGRVDQQFETEKKATENRNYYFGSPYDSNFGDSNLDKLAWFVGNRTEEFARQIIAKVEAFTTNPELTRMLYEVNEKSRKVR